MNFILAWWLLNLGIFSSRNTDRDTSRDHQRRDKERFEFGEDTEMASEAFCMDGSSELQSMN